MENKNNGGIIAILIILSISLGGYILYDKLNIKYNDNSSLKTTTVDTKTKDTNKESKQCETPSKTSVTNFYPDSVAVVSDGSVYVNVYGSTPEIDGLFGNGTFQVLQATINKYKEYTFNNFEYYKNNSKFKGMKLNVNNVDKVYSYDYGQSMAQNYGLILLNKDKSLSMISLYSLINGKTDVKTIPNINGINSIISENNGGMYTYAVKENGEKIDLNDYIPQDYKQF